MILDIYIFLTITSVILIALSYYINKDADNLDSTIVLRTAGSIGLLILGLAMIQGDIQYNNGTTLNTTGSVTTITPNYSNYTNHMIGFPITILGAILFIIMLMEIKNNRRQEE